MKTLAHILNVLKGHATIKGRKILSAWGHDSKHHWRKYTDGTHEVSKDGVHWKRAP